MKMFLGGYPFGAVECEMDDVIEELEEYPEAGELEDGQAFVGLENEDHVILNIVKLGDNNYGVVAGDAERKGINYKEVKKIISDFFAGKYPEWAENMEKNDFKDGIDDILDGEW